MFATGALGATLCIARVDGSHHPASMSQTAPLTRVLRAAALAITVAACGADQKSGVERRPIPEYGHQGYRQDIPDAKRGNAVFEQAAFAREGNYLITTGTGLHVWNAVNGGLLRIIPGFLDRRDRIVVDGTRHLLIARRGAIAPNEANAPGLWIWDLRDGTKVTVIPEAENAQLSPIGITPAGGVVVMRAGAIEVWALDGSGRRMMIEPPAGQKLCTSGGGGSVTYNDKQCAELSHSGRWLAVVARNPDSTMAPGQAYVADLQRGVLSRVTVPTQAASDWFDSFSFSNDDRVLAMGGSSGLTMITINADGIAADSAGASFIAGDHKRNHFLVPMLLSADDDRLIALGDQLQVSVFDPASHELIGRVVPPAKDWEGSLRVSANGARAVTYRFVADILVVIDGRTGQQRGYVCPYFCNQLHNPVELPYAVTADGRRVAVGGKPGAGIFDIDADTLVAPLNDPAMSALPKR